MKKRIISITLVLMLLVGTLFTGMFSVSAEEGEYYEPKSYVPSDCVYGVGTYRYFFLLPNDWRNQWTDSAGIYWWSGTDSCVFLGSQAGVKWPGYKMYQYSSEEVTMYADNDKESGEAVVTGTVWYLDVPADVTTIIFSNALDGGDTSWDNFDKERFMNAYCTVNVDVEGIWPEDGNPNYPGPKKVETMNNMIYIIDPEKTSTSVTGKQTFTGDWYFYHGGDKWDTQLNPIYGGAYGETPDYVEPSSPEPPVSDTEQTSSMIYFKVPDNWNNVTLMYAHIWMCIDDGTIKWPEWKTRIEKMTYIGNGIWAYDTINAGPIDPDKGAAYAVVFVNNNDMQTYNLIFGADCLGDTAYVTGNIFENPADRNKNAIEAGWKSGKYGPEKAILSTGKGIVGDTLPEGKTDAILMANWLRAYYADSTKTKYVDSLLEKLDVTGEEVYDELVNITSHLPEDEKGKMLEICADLLGYKSQISPSKTFFAFCINEDTAEEMKGLMTFNAEANSAEYTFENLSAGYYTIRVVDVENLREVALSSIGFYGDKKQNLQTIYNVSSGKLRINLLEIGEQPPQQNITKSDLENLVDKANSSIEPGTLYSDESQKAFDDALDYAQEVLSKEKPTQEELDNAYNQLNEAINGLETVGHTAVPYTIGDYDQDGDISVKDATAIQMLIAKFTQNNSYYCMADVDGDFSITIKDTTAIQLYCAKFIGESTSVNTGKQSINYYYNELYTV